MAVRLTKGAPSMNVDFDITGTGVTSGTTTQYEAYINTPIQFNDLSTNNPTEWLWDFGDGTTSRLQNPTKTYTALSTGYTVSLLAGKDGAGDYTEKTAFVNIVVQPSANLFNAFSGGVAGYSLRKLNNDVTNVVRVRNSADNSEADYSDIDVLSGLTTIGSNSGLVTTMYDQANVIGNIVQTTQSGQPIIKNAGTLVTLNGLPSINNSGKSGFIRTGGNYNFNTIDELWIFCVINKPATGVADWIILETSDNYNATPGAFLFYFETASLFKFNQKITGGSQYYDANFNVTESGQILVTGRIKTNTAYPDAIKLWVNGVEKTNIFNDTGELTTSFPNTSFNVLSRTGAIAPYNDKVQEIVLFSGDQSANRADIEQNIRDYYGF
jgi:PKD repeat protein